MPTTSDFPKGSFEEVVLKSEDALRRSYYLSNKICQICLKSIDELERQGKNHGAGRRVVSDYLSKHLEIVQAMIDLLGYEPDMEECHSLYGGG